MKGDLTLLNLKRRLQQDLLTAGIPAVDCQHEVDLIVEDATGWRLADQILNESEAVSEAAVTKIAEVCAMRQKRIPLQYCLGYTHFHGLRIAVRPGVLIPRADTEVLVEVFLSRLPAAAVDVAEIGTGSGAVSIAVLKARPDVKLTGIDISPVAIEITAENACQHAVDSRLNLVAGSWDEVLPQGLDAIVSNPPYIAAVAAETLQPEVAKYEPPEALFGDDADGLGFYRRFSRQGRQHLNAGGLIALEVGAGQANAVVEMLQQAGWQDIQVKNDLSGIARVVSAVASNQGFANS